MRPLLLLLAWFVAACSLSVRSPVVAITAPTGEAVCSAFAARGHLYTAAHCVHRDPVTFVANAPMTFGVKLAPVTRINRDQDWAVLQPAIALPELIIAEPMRGPAEVQAARADWSVAFGTLLEAYYAGNTIDGSDVERWFAALDVEPGWSGSPVLQAGHVVGILQSCRGDLWPKKACARPGYVTLFPVSSIPL